MKRHQKSIGILVLLSVLFLALCGMSSCNTSAASASSITNTTTKLVTTATVVTITTETTLQTSASEETTAPSTTTTAVEPSGTQMVAGGVLKIHYIDVGQADSEFVELPDGKTMLIDAGNKGDESIVISYILNLGYSTIDYLVATHPHEDHIGGMATIINGFDIGQIYMPKVASTTQTFEDLLTTIQNKGYTIKTAQAGVQIAPGITILSPAVGSDYGDELNDWSAVISVVYGSKTFLFMGDAGTKPESTFAIDANVIKISHHGSRTAYSTSLYKNMIPEFAIVSVGANNTYGLPDEEVLQGLFDSGTKIYRTDLNGTIIIESDGTKLTIKTSGASAPYIPVPTSKPTIEPTTKPSATTTESSSHAGSGTVYITDTGSKYHRDGCRYLNESQHEISKADAIAQGYEPCKVCKP